MGLLAMLMALACVGSFSAPEPDLESAYVQVGLAALEDWQRQLGAPAVDAFTGLPQPPPGMVEELTRLYEVTKLPAARNRLVTVLNAFEVPTRYGFSHDGTLVASISRMELKREVFAAYSLFLVDIENRSGLPIPVREWELDLVKRDGSPAAIDRLTPAHPLYPALSRMVSGFSPPAVLRSGVINSFKIIVAHPQLTHRDLAYLRISFDGRRIVIKFYENLD